MSSSKHTASLCAQTHTEPLHLHTTAVDVTPLSLKISSQRVCLNVTRPSSPLLPCWSFPSSINPPARTRFSGEKVTDWRCRHQTVNFLTALLTLALLLCNRYFTHDYLLRRKQDYFSDSYFI